MKKRILSIVLAGIMIAAMMPLSAITALADTSIAVPAKEPTCIEAGWQQYYKLGEKLYEDAECLIEIPVLTQWSGYAPATGIHTFVYKNNTQHKCKYCDEIENHSFDDNGVCTACGAEKAVYYEYNTETRTMDKKTTPAAATILSSAEDSVRLSAAWYLVRGEVTISGTLTLEGDAHIILADGCLLNVQKGIIGAKGANLTFYAQTEDFDLMGKVMTIDTYSYNAGIGSARQGECGNITINGGAFYAQGGLNAAGIGAGADGKCGTITINGGKVFSIGGDFGAGIGSGFRMDDGYPNTCAGVVINGGVIIAVGTYGAQNIGAGKDSPAVALTVAKGVYENKDYPFASINIEPFPEKQPSCADGHRDYFKNMVNGKYYTTETLEPDSLIEDIDKWLAGEGNTGKGTGNHADKNEDGYCDGCGMPARTNINYYISHTGEPAFTVSCTAGKELMEQVDTLADKAVEEKYGTGVGLVNYLYSDGKLVKEYDLVPFGTESMDIFAVLAHEGTNPDCTHSGRLEYFENTQDGYFYEDDLCVTFIGDADALAEWFAEGGLGDPPTGKHTDANGDNRCDVCGEIIDKTIPGYDGISLTLGSDISINFYMNLPDDARQNGKMTFNIGGRIVTVDGKDAKYNETEKKYYFQTPLTVLEMAETVTATFSYNGIDYVENYSVFDYIAEIVNNEAKYGKEAVALAKKIANYGYYAQIYLASIHTNVKIVESGEGYDEMIDLWKDNISVAAAKKALAKYSVQVTGTSSNISLYGSTVYFDNATALNYYVTVKDGVLPTATAKNTVTGKGKQVEIKLYKDNIYIVSVKDITATELSDDIAVTINGEITFSGSVFAYCNSVMSKDGQTDAAKNAMAAFFEYYAAAKEYAKLFVFPHHSTLDEYTWEELKTVSNAISEGTISDDEMAHFETFANEAQTKKVVLDNGDALYVRIIGFNHDALCADTTQKAGITFMAVNSLNHGYYSGNEGSDESTYAVGWAAVNGSSPLREKMQQYGEIYNLLPDELTKQIQQVQKQSREGWVSEETYSSTLICTDDYLFLLSGDEIGTDEFNPEGESDTEGTEYEYINCSVYPDNWTTDSGVLFLNINAKGYEFIKEHIAEYDDFSEMRYAIMDAGGFVECDYCNCSIFRSVANDCYDYCGAVYFNGFIMKNHVWMSSCVAPCFCI